MKLTSTSLATFRTCQRKFYFEQVLGRGGDESVHTHAGACLAKALETSRRAFFERGDNAAQARDEAELELHKAWGDPLRYAGETKNLHRVSQAIDKYFIDFPLDQDYRCVAIEKYFEAPLAGITYAGRADAIIEKGGLLWILDDKTTGSSLDSKWKAQWMRRAQFSAYCWGMSQIGLQVAGCLVRGISIQKSRISTLEITVPRPSFLIDEWLLTASKECETILARNDGDFLEYPLYSPSFDNCHNDYGKPCRFFDSCQTADPEAQVMLMPVSRYDPETRTRT
jgi:hypothetical protein